MYYNYVFVVADVGSKMMVKAKVFLSLWMLIFVDGYHFPMGSVS